MHARTHSRAHIPPLSDLNQGGSSAAPAAPIHPLPSSPPPLQCPPLCLCVPSANFAVKVSDRRQIYTYHFMAATNAPPDSLLSIHAASLRCAPGFRSCRWVRVCARPSDVRLKAQQTRHDHMISLTEIILQSLEEKKKKAEVKQKLTKSKRRVCNLCTCSNRPTVSAQLLRISSINRVMFARLLW